MGWAGQIYSFAKSKEIYQCPDDTGTAPLVSYAYNGNLAGNYSTGGGTQRGKTMNTAASVPCAAAPINVAMSDRQGQDLVALNGGDQFLRT